MKVIAMGYQGVYVVEATTQELAALADRVITHREGGGYDASYNAIRIGTVFNISEAYKQINRNKERKREVEMLRAALTGMIANLDMIVPFVEEPPWKHR